MDNIAIVTDTTADIPEELAKEYDISVIPLYVGYDGEMFKEGKEITNKDVYEKLEAGVKVNTSTPSTMDFVDMYRDLIKNKKKNFIYSIHLSSKLSGTVNAAIQAKKFFPDTKIKVIDSKNVTISLGFIVLEAARAARKGLGEEKIDQIIDELKEKTKFFATIENFEYLFKGGRAPFLGKFLSSAVRFAPILTIGKDGKVKLKKFTRNINSAVLELYKQTKKTASPTHPNKIGIFYGEDKSLALELKKMITDDKDIKVDELVLTEITTIMSAHTGPTIWGIAVAPKIDFC